jgi:hypothetical protein
MAPNYHFIKKFFFMTFNENVKTLLEKSQNFQRKQS